MLLVLICQADSKHISSSADRLTHEEVPPSNRGWDTNYLD